MRGVIEQAGSLPTWQRIVLVLVVSVAVAKVVKVLGSWWLERSSHLEEKYHRVIVEEIHYPLYASIALGGLYVTLDLLGLPTRIAFFVSATALTVIVVLWAYAATRIGNRVLRDVRSGEGWSDFAPVMKNLWSFFVLIGAFFVLLSVWRVDVTPILASAGVIGIVLGIAARDSIGNLFAGIMLHLDNTYKVGDMIRLSDGERGTVTDISIRSTTILTRDNVEITIPNAELNTTQVINESAPRRRLRIRLDVGVAYGSDLALVERALLEVAEEEPLVLDSPAPVVRYREFGSSAILAQLQCYIENPALRGRAHHFLILGIDAAFEREGVKIPFPQRELSFLDSGNTVSVAASGEETSDGRAILGRYGDGAVSDDAPFDERNGNGEGSDDVFESEDGEQGPPG